MLKSNPLLLGDSPEDDEKRKKMMLERKKEYNEFKRLQDEKFRNRFRTNSSNDPSRMPQNKSENYTSEFPIHSSEFNGNMSRQLEAIQNQLDNFVNNTSNYSKSEQQVGEQIDESDLDRQYNYIRNIESKFKQLEMNFYAVPTSEINNNNQESRKQFSDPISVNSKSRKSSATPRSSSRPIRNMNNGSSENDKKLQYRQELEKQIEEKKRLKMKTNEVKGSFFDYFSPEKPQNQTISIPTRRKISNFNNERLNQSDNSINIPRTNKEPKTLNYAEELKRQIEEDRYRKELEKSRESEFDRKKEREIQEYNPFFDKRGGGGDPPIVKSLDRSPAPYQKPESNARGGNGIFGQPHTETEKIKTQNYKKLLMEQMEEKKRLLQEKKAREAEEEAKAERNYQEYQAKLNKEHDRQEQNRVPKSYPEQTQNTNGQMNDSTQPEPKRGIEIYQPVSIQESQVNRGEPVRIDPSKRPTSPSLYISYSELENTSKRRVRSSDGNKNSTNTVVNELNNLKKTIAEEKNKIEKLIQTKKYSQEREIYELEEMYRKMPTGKSSKKVQPKVETGRVDLNMDRPQNEYFSKLKNQLKKKKNTPYFVDDNQTGKDRKDNPIKSKSQFIAIEDDDEDDDTEPNNVDLVSESSLDIEQILEHNKERLKRLIESNDSQNNRDDSNLEFVLNDNTDYSETF